MSFMSCLNHTFCFFTFIFLHLFCKQDNNMQIKQIWIVGRRIFPSFDRAGNFFVLILACFFCLFVFLKVKRRVYLCSSFQPQSVNKNRNKLSWRLNVHLQRRKGRGQRFDISFWICELSIRHTDPQKAHMDVKHPPSFLFWVSVSGSGFMEGAICRRFMTLIRGNVVTEIQLGRNDCFSEGSETKHRC